MMYLKTDRITVNIKDLTITSHKNMAAESQYNLDPTGMSGWLDGVDPRRNTTPRLGGHGDFTESTFLNARLISFSGVAMAKTPQALRVMRDKFVGALGNGDYTEISVTMGGNKRYATVGVEGKPSWILINDNNAAWKIDLYAPDPFIYGPEQIIQTGSALTIGGLSYPLEYTIDYMTVGLDTSQAVANEGNAIAWPKFRVTGDYAAGFTITNNQGRKVTYNGIVTSQAPVTIDMAKGTAVQSGVDKTILLSDRGWFSIHAYESIKPTFKPIQNGYGWCDIIFRDTYI